MLNIGPGVEKENRIDEAASQNPYRKTDTDHDGRPVAGEKMIRRVNAALQDLEDLREVVQPLHSPIKPSMARHVAYQAGRRQIYREIFDAFGFQLPR